MAIGVEISRLEETLTVVIKAPLSRNPALSEKAQRRITEKEEIIALGTGTD